MATSRINIIQNQNEGYTDKIVGGTIDTTEETKLNREKDIGG